MKVDPKVEAAVIKLEGFPLGGLREHWPQRFGPLPRIRSPDLLRRMIAYRLQEKAYGGLDTETRRLLARKVTVDRGPKLGVGARLVREWKGELHEVEITAEEAVLYQGETYASLSEAARAITGTRWNGPRFFGLRGTA